VRGKNSLKSITLLASQRIPKKKVVNERLANTVKQSQRAEKEVKQRLPGMLKTN
jgi:hypothetical protein